MAHLRHGAPSLFAGALAALLLFPSFGQAKPAAPADKPVVAADPFEGAREAENRLDYKAVVANASKALESAQPHDRLVTLYRMLGTAQAVLGKNQEAVDAFTKLLAVDPDHKLPRGTSPKINAPFKEAGGFWVDRPGGLQVTPTLPREVTGGKLVPIPVKLDDALNLTANVRASYRIQGDTEWKKLEAPMSPAVSITIPAAELPVKEVDYVLELYFAALSANGSELRMAGDAARPLSIAVRSPIATSAKVSTTSTGALVISQPEKPKKPLIKQWWLWAAVGGVVLVGVGLGAGLGYAYGRPDMSKVDINLTSRTAP